MNFDYEYFTSANCVLSIEGMPLTEVAGLRLSISESKRPIYGYSSRHFDAVASGQVLVQGALVLNYVDQNYLFQAIKLGLQNSGQLKSTAAPPDLALAQELQDQIRTTDGAANLLQQYLQDPVGNKQIAEAFKQSAWGSGGITEAGSSVVTPNPHDAFAALDLDITFGTREVYNFYRGMTNCKVQSLHFLGRSLPIAISEDVIVEEYPFFARNIVQVEDNYHVSFNTGGTAQTVNPSVSLIKKE